MKINCIIFAVFTLGVMVKGTWWAAAVQPVILSLGAILAAVDPDIQPIEWKNYLPFVNKDTEKESKEQTKD